MKNTIVADNTGGPDCGGTGIITSNDHNLDSDNSCNLTGANDISSGTADLGLLANNGGPTKTHALGPNSDARQAGNTTLTTDQRGFARPAPAGTVPDIGAFEAGLPNTPPTVDPQTVDTTGDTPVLITLTGSDADTADSISFKVTRLPNSGDLSDGSPITTPRAISGDTVTYTPNAGVTGTDSFDFIANDATVDSAPATVTVNINAPPNNPPVADPQTVDTTGDTPVLITLTGSDADAADSISFKVTRLPNSGDLSDGTPLAAPRGISGDTVTYTPNAGVTGTDSFDFIANDATVDSAPATVTVNINPPPPGPESLPRMPSFQQQLDILSGDGVPPELAHSAINQLPGMLLGTPVVLPTSGGTVTMETWMETIRFFDRATTDLMDAIHTLTMVKMGTAAGPPHADPSVRAHANQVSALLEGALSVIRGLGFQVAGTDPAGTIPPHLRTQRSKIEGPFLPLAPMKFGHFPIERTEVCNVDRSESSGGGTTSGGSFSEFSKHSSACIITKESFGVKAVLFHRIIPIFQEPWDVRESPIIGHEVVWYIRWIPAEHIKTIIYEPDTSGRIRTRIRQHDILMPGLSKFWSFYPPGIPDVVVQAPPGP